MGITISHPDTLVPKPYFYYCHWNTGIELNGLYKYVLMYGGNIHT